MAITQTDRSIAISTVLGGDALLLRSLEGTEAVSNCFGFTLGLLSENDAINLEDLVGTRATVAITDADGTARCWNGYISRFTQGTRERVLTEYTAQLVPWLWFLTLRTDSRIFQEMTVRDIVTDVFSRAEFHDFEWRTQGTCRTRDYCVQYQETDFDFVSRLLEDEGICYFFEHTADKHVLVLADDASAYKPCAGQESVRYATSRGGFLREDRITEWKAGRAFCTSGVSLADFNFTTPKTDLTVSVEGDNAFQTYHYPGGYPVRGEGQSLVDVRSEELRSRLETIDGTSTCRAFRAGTRFDLLDHYRTDFNRPYVITRVRHAAFEGGYDIGVGRSSSDGSRYTNDFVCIPASVAFRPERRTWRQRVDGCQTATVVGPSGSEIYTDEYGRVKVQFHWDRQGQRNERSSCWIRVAQAWAGAGWGAVAIPRIGQEVVVDFLEGDPDRPIIVGTVYNAAQMPPYKLPANGDMTGIRSNTTKGGNGYNEVAFRDKESEELIRIHAQGDMHVTVRRDVAEQFERNHAELVTGERYLKARRIILEAEDEICIKVGGNHVQISSSGVNVEGKMVDVNCGHPASNTGIAALKPEAPRDREQN